MQSCRDKLVHFFSVSVELSVHIQMCLQSILFVDKHDGQAKIENDKKQITVIQPIKHQIRLI